MPIWFSVQETHIFLAPGILTNNAPAIYYSCATLSGAFGGLIAYGIELNLSYDGTGRYSWSWLFLVEGVIAIGAGLLIMVFLPRMPDDLQRRGGRHWLFTKEEIDLAAKRQACK